jgi:hypothetical protein
MLVGAQARSVYARAHANEGYKQDCGEGTARIHNTSLTSTYMYATRRFQGLFYTRQVLGGISIKENLTVTTTHPGSGPSHIAKFTVNRLIPFHSSHDITTGYM